MGRAKLILLYGWLFFATFGSITIATSLNVAFFLTIFSLGCSILVVVIGAKRTESTAGIERLITLSKWLEKGLSYRAGQVIASLIWIPLVPLQKLGCHIFIKHYQYRFGEVVLRTFNEVTQKYHAAVIIFPYAVMVTTGLVILLISHNG